MRPNHPILHLLTILCAVALLSHPAHSVDAWPAEEITNAVNMTALGDDQPNDGGFRVDLSGLYWNEGRQELWLVRNGGPGGSKMWVMEPYQLSGATHWRIKNKDGNRGEWTGFGDLEDITFAHDSSHVAYLLIEGQERIQGYRVDTYGQKVLVNNYDTSAYLPVNGGLGAEGIAFVPNERLQAIGFTADNATGQPALRLGNRGMEGLMFVGHQNGGALYVFDLDPNSNSFDYVGKYLTGYSETAALAFDRSTGEMYIRHDGGHHKLEVTDLRSTRVGPQTYRLKTKRAFSQPTPFSGTSGIEGIAIRPKTACGGSGREFFVAVDGGGANSLFRFTQFRDGCSPARCVTNTDCPGGQICGDKLTRGGLGTCYTCPMDLNGMGVIEGNDKQIFFTCGEGPYDANHPCQRMNFDGSLDGRITDADANIMAYGMGLPVSSYGSICQQVRLRMQNYAATVAAMPARMGSSSISAMGTTTAPPATAAIPPRDDSKD